MEDKLRQREEEIAESSERMRQREAESEQLHEEMSNLKREHAHTVDQQNRALQEVSLQESEARTQMEGLVRQQASAELEMNGSKDKVNALKEEVERLRRQIHELQQESADKEVKFAHLTKQRAEDREDLAGLNLALDSKQQELELVSYRSIYVVPSHTDLSLMYRSKERSECEEQEAAPLLLPRGPFVVTQLPSALPLSTVPLQSFLMLAVQQAINARFPVARSIHLPQSRLLRLGKVHR